MSALLRGLRQTFSCRPDGAAVRLLVAESGIAAVEFAIILPILVVLWIGGVEVTAALSVDRRINNFAAAVGDLVARSKTITHADVDNIFDLGEGAMFPHGITSLQIRVTEVAIDEDGASEVYWSRAQGSDITAHADGASMDDLVPETLRVPDSHVVMSEVFYTYSPAVGYVITGDLELTDRMFFVPRVSTKVKLCATTDTSTCTS